MSIIGSNILAGASGQAGGGGAYEIERSVRFSSSDSAYLSRVFPTIATNQKITYSLWVKRSALGTTQCLLDTNRGYQTSIDFLSSNALRIYTGNGGGVGSFDWTTAQVFRDCSSWYHIVVAWDTTQGSAVNRLKVYVNGAEVTNWSSQETITQNMQLGFSGATVLIGNSLASSYLSAYLADVFLIDSQALTPSSFGEFDTNGVWQPIAYAGSYGTNGFHLPFSDNSTAAALGTDTSSNGNTWTVNNFSVAQGNGSYIGSTSGSLYSGSWINAFNGVATPVFGGSGKPYNYDTTSTLTFSSALSGIIEVYGANGSVASTGGTAYIALSDGSQWSVASITSPNAQWYSFGSKTGITSISLFSNNTSSGTWLGAIRVNGVVLVDRSFSSGNDSLVDSPSQIADQTDTGVGGEVVGNYCTWNPLSRPSSATLSNGNLDATYGTSSYPHLASDGTIQYPTSGKWYYEVSVVTVGELMVGFRNVVSGAQTRYYRDNSGGYNNIAIEVTASAGQYSVVGYTNGDVIGVALNCDALTVAFYKNGTQVGSTYSLTTVSNLVPFATHSSTGGGAVATANFGQRAFAYTAPSGFKALVDTNLPTPVVAKGSAAMDVKLYTGNAGTQSITGLGFNPDLVWIKGRNATPWHAIFDSVRGTGLRLSSNVTNAETGNGSTDLLQSFDSGGFTVNTTLNGTPGDTSVNWDGSGGAASSYVAWTWDAGSSTVTNTAGSITSQVRANASSGFSIVTWTGTMSPSTIGHGLGVAPQFIIVKRRSSTEAWVCYHRFIDATVPADYDISLNSTAARRDYPSFGDTLPTSTVFSVGATGATNETGETYVAYAFAPVSGYSSFGSYVGNGSSDGSFVYTGFRPKWVMFKRTDTTGYWMMYDSARSPYNAVVNDLNANTSDAEASTGGPVDFVSNGFKQRNTSTYWNASGGTYIYIAFAENPFQYARAR